MTSVLPFENLKKQVHLNTGFFETSQYTEDAQMQVTSGNHDGAGLSIGNLQYNYGAADRAQEWFNYMVNSQRAVVDAAFGTNTVERDEFINVTNTYTRTQRVSWGDSISALDANGEKRLLKEPYKSAFATMLKSAEGKAKYYSMRDAYYWGNPYDIFRQMSCKSRAALASLFDLFVNKGRYYPINCLQTDFDTIDANAAIDDIEKERQKIVKINERGNSEENGLNDSSSAVFAPRRNCMRDQGGTYYGATYDPETQFDINQEPATTEKAGAAPLNVNLGSIAIEDAYLGTTPIQEIYLGATLIGGGSVAPYTTQTAPQTQFRTNSNSYAGIGAVTSVDLTAGQPLWVDVQNFVACRTYYTTDGSEPTTASALYTGVLSFQQTTTLKCKTISIFGVAEPTKTLTINIPAAATGWRYLKIEGYGATEAGQEVTTRLIEFEAWEGATNRMSGLADTAITWQTPNNSVAISTNTIKDGVKGTASNSYPFWWTATPNANIVIDLGAQRALTKLNYYGYSVSGVQRNNRFKVLASNTNNGTDWTPIWDNSTGQLGMQPLLPSGYEKVL